MIPAIPWVLLVCFFWKIQRTRNSFRSLHLLLCRREHFQWEVHWEMIYRDDILSSLKNVHTHTVVICCYMWFHHINIYIYIFNRCLCILQTYLLHFYARNCLADLDWSRSPFLDNARLNGTFRWRSWLSKTAVTHQRVGHHLQANTRELTYPSNGKGNVLFPSTLGWDIT